MSADETLVTITSGAVSRLKDIAAAENRTAMNLRIAAVRTRCMGGRGYGYRIGFEDSPAADDARSEQEGITVCVDPASVRLLAGARLDYLETPAQTGFKLDNPNVIAKCPCGHHDIFE